MGLCSGVATRKLIKWLRHRGAKPPQVRLQLHGVVYQPLCTSVAGTLFT